MNYRVGSYVKIVTGIDAGEIGRFEEIGLTGEQGWGNLKRITGQHANGPAVSFRFDEVEPHEPFYPEHEKLKALGGQNQIVGDFIEWLGTQGRVIAEYDKHDRLYPVFHSRDQMLADFFEIDLKRLNREKDLILEDFRLAQQELEEA